MFLGRFGSGKTEVAINYALALARAGARPWLVDLDTVTPFFRSRDLGWVLDEAGVKVVAPQGPTSMADLPALPPEIHAALQAWRDRVVVDLGGEPRGARVLGAWHQYFVPGKYEALVVANARRPFTTDTAGILRAVGELEAAARVRATGLVSNTHLGELTTLEVVRQGDRIVRKAARMLGLPVAFLALKEELAAEAVSLPPPVFIIRRYLTMPFGSGSDTAGGQSDEGGKPDGQTGGL